MYNNYNIKKELKKRVEKREKRNPTTHESRENRREGIGDEMEGWKDGGMG